MLCGVQRSSGSGASTMKWSSRMNAIMQSGVLRLTTAAAPHSRIFAACQARPGAKPARIGSPAKIAVSLERPASTTSAPASSARRKGSAPIMPTMRSARSIVCASNCGAGIERLDAAFAQPPLEIGLVLLGMDQRELERQRFLARDFPEDVERPFEVGVGARGAGRSDQQRNAEPARADQHQPQVALDRGPRKRRVSRAKMARAGVGRAGVAADEMGRARERPLERRFDESRSQHAGGGKNSELVGNAVRHGDALFRLA